MCFVVLVVGFYTLRPIHILSVKGMELAHDNFDNDGFIILVRNYDALKNKLALSHFLDICIHVPSPEELCLLRGAAALGLGDPRFDPRDLAAKISLLERILDVPDHHLESKVKIFLSKLIALDEHLVQLYIFK
jgi:hypothetical protein